MAASLVTLLDVDNTLIDNDRVKAHLQAETLAALGEAGDRRIWQLYEEVRDQLDVVSVPVTLERLRAEWPDAAAIDALGQRLFATPFAEFVYAAARDLLAWLRGQGLPVILSDGDSWYQAKKITDAGLGAATGGNVLIYHHKEQHVAEIQRWYPAERYIAVDDKARLLGLLKHAFGGRLTTIWVRQGHYAADGLDGEGPPPDVSVADLGGVRAAIERLAPSPAPDAVKP